MTKLSLDYLILGILKGKNPKESHERMTKIEEVIINAHLFKKSHIKKSALGYLGACKNCDLFIIDWFSSQHYWDELWEGNIIAEINDRPTLIYAPLSEGRIADTHIKKINDHQNMLVVNFVGRLLNDLLVSGLLGQLRKNAPLSKNQLIEENYNGYIE